jgi:hypothetical protein
MGSKITPIKKPRKGTKVKTAKKYCNRPTFEFTSSLTWLNLLTSDNYLTPPATDGVCWQLFCPAKKVTARGVPQPGLVKRFLNRLKFI